MARWLALFTILIAGCAVAPTGSTPWKMTGDSGPAGNRYVRQELWCTLKPGGDGGSWCSARGRAGPSRSFGYNSDCEAGLDVGRTSWWLHPADYITEDDPARASHLTNFNIEWSDEGGDFQLMVVHVDKPERGVVYGFIQCEPT